MAAPVMACYSITHRRREIDRCSAGWRHLRTHIGDRWHKTLKIDAPGQRHFDGVGTYYPCNILGKPGILGGSKSKSLDQWIRSGLIALFTSDKYDTRSNNQQE